MTTEINPNDEHLQKDNNENEEDVSTMKKNIQVEHESNSKSSNIPPPDEFIDSSSNDNANKCSYISSSNHSVQEGFGDGWNAVDFVDNAPQPEQIINNHNVSIEFNVAQEFVQKVNQIQSIDIDHILNGADAVLQNISDEIRNYRDEAIGLLNYPRERYLDYVQLHNEIENAPIPIEALSDLGEEISDADDNWDENNDDNDDGDLNCSASNQLLMGGDPGPYYDQFRREHQQVEQHRMYINGQIEPEVINHDRIDHHQPNTDSEFVDSVQDSSTLSS